jgi:hypothetical protein
MLAGDQDCAAALARGALGRSTDGKHFQEHQVSKHILFATSIPTRETLSTTRRVEDHGDAVKLIADGESLRKSENESVRKLAVWMTESTEKRMADIVPCTSSTHRVGAQADFSFATNICCKLAHYRGVPLSGHGGLEGRKSPRSHHHLHDLGAARDDYGRCARRILLRRLDGTPRCEVPWHDVSDQQSIRLQTRLLLLRSTGDQHTEATST